MILPGFYNTPTLKGFYAPTQIISGPEARQLLFKLLEEHKSNLGLLVDEFFTDDPFVQELKEKTGPRLILSETISSEPTSETISQLVDRLAGRNISCLMAIGGGSTIDAAKGLTAAIKEGGYRQKDTIALPGEPHIIALPTTAGTGSEASRYYVITDSTTGAKESFRSWGISPQTALLDPYFLKNSPKKLLFLSAFDAFCHLWETMVCRGEKSTFNDILSLEGMGLIISSLTRLSEGHQETTGLINLQRASALGGIALSNVRTGLLHKLAEGLGSLTSLPHAGTLIPFFRPVLTHYEKEATLVTKRLNARLTEHGTLNLNTATELINFWTQLFKTFKLVPNLAKQPLDFDSIIRYVMQDHVLFKEHPVALNEEEIRKIIDQSLKQEKPHA